MVRTAPSAHTFSLNETETAAILNAGVRDVGTFLATRPAFAGWQNTASVQSTTSGTWTNINLAIIDVDTDTGWTSGSPERYVCHAAGWYFVAGCVVWANNATGARMARLAINGTPSIGAAASIKPGSGDVTSVFCAGFTFLNLNDFVVVQGRQTSGGALSTATATAASSALKCVWVST